MCAGWGLVLWELLARQRASCSAEDERRMIHLVQSQALPSFAHGRIARCRRIWRRSLCHATAVDPADRIGRAGTLAQLLQMWLDGVQIPLRPPSTGELLMRWARQNKPLVLTGSLAVATVLAVVGVAATRNIQARRLAEANAKAATIARGQAEESKCAGAAKHGAGASGARRHFERDRGKRGFSWHGAV